MVGTRSGISITDLSKQEKTKMRTKDVKKKGLGQESNKHGVGFVECDPVITPMVRPEVPLLGHLFLLKTLLSPLSEKL